MAVNSVLVDTAVVVKYKVGVDDKIHSSVNYFTMPKIAYLQNYTLKI